MYGVRPSPACNDSTQPILYIIGSVRLWDTPEVFFYA